MLPVMSDCFVAAVALMSPFETVYPHNQTMLQASKDNPTHMSMLPPSLLNQPIPQYPKAWVHPGEAAPRLALDEQEVKWGLAGCTC
jgi:hypothetical protein